MTNLTLLMELLAVPTLTYNEEEMVAWLEKYFTNAGLSYTKDESGNLYVTKGILVNGDHYPCVAAHTDTVHFPEKVEIVKRDDRLVALDTERLQTGLGGDDKSGIYICLELLKRLPVIKAAFFVSEETGCHGSSACDKSFFDNVGYVMQYDSPCDDIMTYTCSGVQLFPDEGAFHDIMLPIVKAHGVTNWQHHPYTDVSVLKRMFNFPCLNLPAGYFRMHSPQEYVSIKAVDNGIKLGLTLIQALGTKKYVYEATKCPGKPALRVSYLRTHG